MNPQPSNVDPPCATIVYRAIRRKDWIDIDDEHRAKAEAFHRRPGKDGDGLSVYDSFRIEAQACIEDQQSCYGLMTLHVGTLRALGLKVTRDSENQKKILVTNIPFANSGDPKQEALLDSVAATARICHRCKWKRPDPA